MRNICPSNLVVLKTHKEVSPNGQYFKMITQHILRAGVKTDQNLRPLSFCSNLLYHDVIVEVHGPQSSLMIVRSKSKSLAASILSLTARVTLFHQQINKPAAFLLNKYFITFHPEFMLSVIRLMVNNILIVAPKCVSISM